MHSTGALGGDRELGRKEYGSIDEETTRLAEYLSQPQEQPQIACPLLLSFCNRVLKSVMKFLYSVVRSDGNYSENVRGIM